MKKEEIFVRIDSEEKRLRAIQILTDAGEYIWNESSILSIHGFGSIRFLLSRGEWFYVNNTGHLIEITLDQLEQMLAVQEVNLTVDEIRLQAEKLGFELVEKKREVKVGDFCKVWDDVESDCCVGFIREIDKFTDYKFRIDSGAGYYNASHLTDEEKQKIQETW